MKLLAECYKRKHFTGTRYDRDISHEKVHCKINIPSLEVVRNFLRVLTNVLLPSSDLKNTSVALEAD